MTNPFTDTDDPCPCVLDLGEPDPECPYCEDGELTREGAIQLAYERAVADADHLALMLE